MPNSLTGSNFGVQTASAIPGMAGPLDFGNTNQEVTIQGGIGSGPAEPFSGGNAGLPSGLQDLNFDSSSISTPSFNFGTGAASGSSLLQSAISTLTGGGGLGSIAAIGGEAAAAAYGLSQAKAAQQQAQAQAQQIITATQPFLSGAQQQLAQFQSGKLTPQQQQYVDFTTTEGQDIINSGKGLQTIAQQQLGQFASGQLLPADQLALDRQTAAAKQQIAQKMSASGTADSSIAAGYNQQIDEAAAIQKQQQLNQYFATGNTAYNSWLQSTTQGAALMQQGAQFAQTSFQDMMQNALGLAGVGMSGLTQAIGLEIQSDNELSQSVSSLMANLAAAFAYTVAGPGGGSSAAGGGAGGGILGSLVNLGKAGTSLYNSASSLFSGGSTAGSAASILAGGSPTLASVGVDSISELGSVSDALGGFSSAGGGAAAGVGGGVSAAGEASSAAAMTPSVLGQFSFAPGLSSVGTGAVGAATDSAAASAASALGSSGGAAASGGASAGATAAGASSLGAAGLAIPLAAAAIPFIFGQMSAKGNDEGNAATSGWMKATGATWKPNPAANTSGSTFGNYSGYQPTGNGKVASGVSPGTMYDKSGKPMTATQAEKAIVAWAKANGLPTGNLS